MGQGNRATFKRRLIVGDERVAFRVWHDMEAEGKHAVQAIQRWLLRQQALPGIDDQRLGPWHQRSVASRPAGD